MAKASESRLRRGYGCTIVYATTAPGSPGFPWCVTNPGGTLRAGYPSLEQAMSAAPLAPIDATSLQRWRMAFETKLSRRIII